MSRNKPTRAEKAEELFKRLAHGPHLSGDDAKTVEEYVERYRIWSQSWILPDLVKLVPELAKYAKMPSAEFRAAVDAAIKKQEG